MIKFCGSRVTSSLHLTLNTVAALKKKESIQKYLTPWHGIKITSKLEKKWHLTN